MLDTPVVAELKASLAFPVGLSEPVISISVVDVRVRRLKFKV